MPEPRMSAQLARLAKKRGRLPALVTALSLGLLLALQQFLNNGVSYLRLLGYPAPESGAESSAYVQNVAYTFHPTVEQLLFFILPLTLGVFLALWLIAPISDELTTRFVLTRAGLASAGGVLLTIVIRIVKGLVESIGATTSSPWTEPTQSPPPSEGVNFQVFGQNSLDAISYGVGTFIFFTPIVMLAGMLLWLWLRDHPREYAVAGLIDEL